MNILMKESIWVEVTRKLDIDDFQLLVYIKSHSWD